MRQLIKLDLGCGRYKVPGTIGIDKSISVHPDIVADFVKNELPFPDNSAEIIYCRQVLEHIDDIFSVMNKIYRILHPSGRLIVEVPYWSSEGAFRDPTHVRFFSEKSFDYWDPNCECNYYADTSPFRVVRVSHIINRSFAAKMVKWFFGLKGLKAFNNMITGLVFELAPIKS